MSDSTTHNKHTPLVAQALVSAVERGDAQAVEALLSSGAFAEARTAGGETALMRAAAKGFDDVARVLLDAGADPRARRPDGFTPLSLAAFFGREETVRLLLECGADPSARTSLGTTARSWADARGFGHIVALLEQAERTHAAAVAVRKQEPAVEVVVVKRAEVEFQEEAVETPRRREAIAVPFEGISAASRGRESKRFFLSWQASVGMALLFAAFGVAAFAVWRTSNSARRPARNPAPVQTPSQAALPELAPAALTPTPMATPDMGLTNMGPQGPLIVIPGTAQPVLVSPALPPGASDVPVVISESGASDEGTTGRRRPEAAPTPAATPAGRTPDERRADPPAPSDRGTQTPNPETQPRPSAPPPSATPPPPAPTPERRKVIPWPPQ
ncbi:MAG TPA: ankyrin repeat domain-containing protein [Pyrinomonadaceae bacterium]|nr:ankyrin repeat domain-containing protein [Pyrinomonadaceae bacterium]